jgi:Fe-S cluster assembly iron-binding protein IscA
MVVTPAAKTKLLRLAGGTPPAGGLRLEGYLGTCRGSAPSLRPTDTPKHGDEVVDLNGLRLFIPRRFAHLMAGATLDWDPSFMGRGLNLTWPHHERCPCSDPHRAGQMEPNQEPEPE